LIDQHRVDDTAHLNQLLPVTAVAREARYLQCCYGADFTQADLRHHALEAGADNTAGGGASKIVIDGLDLPPSKASEAIAHCILQCAAFSIVQDLVS
jgi:hypothetical protein